MTFKPLSRKHLLRGLGVSMSLPWLESMQPIYGKEKLAKPPVRAAFMFMPNGVWPKDWTPSGEGESYEPDSPFLKHLKKVKNDFILLEHLWHEQSVGRNGHWPKVPVFLSGGRVARTTERNVNVERPSLDQVLAKELGHHTPLPSLELSIDKPVQGIDQVGGGFARLYGNYISWRNDHIPVAGERLPLMAYNRLFKSGPMPSFSGIKNNSLEIRNSIVYDETSVLDLVKNEAKALQSKISLNDREKIDEYFESVRAIEVQIKNSMMPQIRWHNESKYQLDIPDEGIPKDHQTHIRLMLDIMLMAFWTDSTRISTFMFGNGVSGKDYSFLPGVEGHFHSLSHHKEEPEALIKYNKVIHFHMQQMAWLLEKMKGLREGETSLLDNSMVFFGSTIKDGNRHTEEDLPLILAGKAGGAIRSGRRLTSAPKTPLCNLYVEMLNIMGMKSDRFGDSKGRLQLS